MMSPIHNLSESFWTGASQHACFVCGAMWWCKHREPHVEAAMVAAREETV